MASEDIGVVRRITKCHTTHKPEFNYERIHRRHDNRVVDLRALQADTWFGKDSATACANPGFMGSAT